jgi:hypothetical protein
MHKYENLTQVVIHLSTHDHLVAKGHCKKVTEQVKALVKEEVFRTLTFTTLAIVLVVSKIFLFEHLFNENDERLVEVLKAEKLC